MLRCGMEFLDYMLLKLCVFGFAAFCWGVYCGITGYPLGGAQREDHQAKED